MDILVSRVRDMPVRIGNDVESVSEERNSIEKWKTEPKLKLDDQTSDIYMTISTSIDTVSE